MGTLLARKRSILVVRNIRQCGAAAISLIACVSCADSDPTFPEFGDRRLFTDHREFDVRFRNGDAVLAGTIYLPPGNGPFPAVAVSLGSSWTTRATWQDVEVFVTQLNAAVLSYDKRGQGQSSGACCPDDAEATFTLLGGDLVAAARTLRNVTDIAPSQIGVLGSSQGGWVVPLAANAGPSDIAFTIVTVGGAVSTGQENLYDPLTGYDVCAPSGKSMAEIIAELKAAGPSGFDPRQSIEDLTQPGIWIFGGNDLSHPTPLAVEILEEVKESHQKDWTVVVFPTANHDLIDNGEICQVSGNLVDVITPLSEWLGRIRDR